MNDVLEANLEGISGLMQFYHAPRKNYMARKDVLSLLTKDSRVNIPDKVALSCYGMSKMTVVNES